jgi:hypothetical protein
LTLHWASDLDTAIVTQGFGSVAGVFYVEDARQERDAAGRLVIPAADFVNEYGVRTVFGFGGAYSRGTFMATVLFTNERVPRVQAERFMRLASSFKAATLRLVMSGRIFVDPKGTLTR